jgi:CRP-like cAMP-binding protein
LRTVPFLKDLQIEYLNKMAQAAEMIKFTSGQTIIKRGDPGHTFYIIKEGSVQVKDIDVGGRKYDDHVLSKGEFFGERAIIQEEPRAANIVALKNCTTLAITREIFLEVVGPLDELVKKTNDLRVLVSFFCRFQLHFFLFSIRNNN